jgi:hypothetical protein
MDATLQQFVQMLRTTDRDVRAYLVGKLMRQAKPDDVFTFVTVEEISDLWPDVQPYLGRAREFWQWLMASWGKV